MTQQNKHTLTLADRLIADGWEMATHWQDRQTSAESLAKLRKKGKVARRTMRGSISAREFRVWVRLPCPKNRE